ncbi:MAG: 1-acyl-sn-glycerol-3-phosphate acyltransferase, partial [Chitinimonas sp.]|nr:1-acyl-sn-glycerol-3-phosphate acyltransferase [Chitinimonas sp.]
MLELLDRGWRVIATAIAFSSFGLGGLLLRLVYFPLLQLIVRERARQTRLARLSIHHTFRLFIELMRVLGILRYEIVGAERLRRPGLLILANHPTLIDVVFLISLVPNADCVVKAALARNPFTRGPVRATGYICNDSGAGLVEDCVASVHAGNNLIIFPEGTRTPVAGPMKL